MNHIDNTDRHILSILRDNARISFAELGRHVCLTAPAVAYRIQRLEKLGVIKGYQTKVDESTLDGHLIMIIRMSVENSTEKRFIKFIQKCQFVRECCRISGAENFLLKVAMPSTQALDDLLNQLAFYDQPVTSLVIAELTRSS